MIWVEAKGGGGGVEDEHAEVWFKPVRRELLSEGVLSKGVDAPVLKEFSEKLGTSLCGKSCSKKVLTR